MYLQTGNLVEELKYGIILQQVNAQGVMASGIAKEIRAKWPAVWVAYSTLVTPSPEFGLNGQQHLGKISPVEVESNLWVVSIIGQQFYGRDGKRYTSYDALDVGLQQVARWVAETEFTHADIHHPLLGSGLGGGSWPVVKAIIEHRLGSDTTLWTLPGV